MPVCSGGSEPKAGFTQPQLLNGAGWAAIIGTTFQQPEFEILAAFLGLLSVNTATLCASDPPAVPSFTAADIISIIQPNPFLPGTGYDKLQQLADIAAWYTFCQCIGTTTPAPPAAPTYPTGAPVLNPPVPGAPNGPCVNVTVGFDSVNGVYQDIGAQIFNGWTRRVVTTNSSFPNSNAYAVPASMSLTNWMMALTGWSPPSGAGADGICFYAYDAAGNWLGAPRACCTQLAGLSQSGTFSVQPAYLQLYSAVQPTDGQAAFNFTLNCSNSSAPQQPCCPPDPSLIAILTNIQGALQAIYNGLPSVLHTFGNSHNHPNMTGQGLFLLDSTTVAVEVAAHLPIPNTVGVEFSNPIQLFGDNWITFSAQGFANFQSYRLTTTPQYFYVPPGTDTLNYSLAPQLEVDIIELIRST